MVEIALSTATRLTLTSADGACAMMLRQRLAIAATTPNPISMPAAHAPLDRSTRQIPVRS
jgi:hypothetical protein